MAGEQGCSVADGRVEGQVVVAGRVEEDPSETRTTTVGLFGPTIGGYFAHDGTHQAGTRITMGLDEPGVQIHTPTVPPRESL